VGLRRRQAATKVSEEAALIAVAEPAPAAVLGATGGAAWLADIKAESARARESCLGVVTSARARPTEELTDGRDGAQREA
jgi:hypothetical protein